MQADYTVYETGYQQLKLPIETEIFIERASPVRLVNAVAERMDISSITRTYSRAGRIEYPPRILLKIVLYGYVRHIYSSREIERACREKICFCISGSDFLAQHSKMIGVLPALRIISFSLTAAFWNFSTGPKG